MRMNRRIFSAGKPAASVPSEEYAVRLWNSTTFEDYTYGGYPDGVYGFFAPGATVTVDLTDDPSISYISNVSPYVTGGTDTVEWTHIGDVSVRFTMPAFDVAVEIETRY